MAGGRQIPEWVQWVLTFLGGAPWPEADEDAARRVAGYHRQDQHAAEAFQQELDRELQALADAISGQAHDAIAESLKKLIDAARQEGEFHGRLAAATDDFATNVEYTKEMIIGSLIALAVQLGVELALEWCSLGASSIAAAGSIAITRAAIMAFFRELVTKAGAKALGKLLLQGLKIGFKEGMIAAGIGAGLDVGIQLQQTMDGHRQGVNWKQTLETAESGAAGGAAGGLAGRAVGHGVSGIGTGMGKDVSTKGWKAATGAASGLVGGIAGAGAGAAVQGGDLTDLHTWASGVGLGAAMGAAAGFRGRPHVEAPGAAGIEGGAPKRPEVPTTEKPLEHEGTSAASPKPEGQPAHEQPPSAGQQEHGQPSAATPTHDAQPQHEQQATPVAETRQAAPDAKPAPEQQRAAPSGDPSRGGAPIAERQPIGRDQPAPSTSGTERPTSAPSPRLPEQPAVSLSNAGSDKPHAGAAAGMREFPPVKTTEPVAAKPGEQIRATAGLPEARPVEQRLVVEAKPTDHATAGAPETGRSESAGGRSELSQAEPVARPGERETPANGGEINHLGDRFEHAGVAAGDTPERGASATRDHGSVEDPRLGDPEKLRELWEHSTPEERRDLLFRNPDLAKQFDLPQREYEGHLRCALDDLIEDKPDNKALPHVKEALDHDPGKPERHLFSFSRDGERAIVGVGNHETASHIVVNVFGTFTNHENLARYTEVSERMHQAITPLVKESGGSACVVNWQDYRAPQNLKRLDGAMSRQYAKAAAPDLIAFIEQLRRVNPNAIITVTGHSYGAVPIGHAARSGRGLAADGMVTFAGAGMGAVSVVGLKLKDQVLPWGRSPVHSFMHRMDALRPVGLLSWAKHGIMPHWWLFGSKRHMLGSIWGDWRQSGSVHSNHYWEPAVMNEFGQIVADTEFFPERTYPHREGVETSYDPRQEGALRP